MAIRRSKPTTPGRRKMILTDFSEITTKKPEKSLTFGLSKRAGRPKGGKITSRSRGGGAKRLYRKIDFKQIKLNLPAKVQSIEYDPSRSARLALIHYQDGQKSYILAPLGLKVGDEIIASLKGEIKIGNRLQLKNIPLGIPIYNLEIIPQGGGQLVRSAGSSAVITGKEGGYALIKMPSGEIRKINENCFASIGEVSFPEKRLLKLGKAGRRRHRGRRPRVRGKAMVPKDHPHGGGEGRTDIGLRYPKTPWGTPALGKKTRKKKKITSRFIIKRRKR